MTSKLSFQLALLVALVLFSPLGIDLYLPALPDIAKEFHVEHTLAQDTITWFLFAMGIGQLVAGPLADKLGRRTIGLMGISLFGFSALAAWYAFSIESLLVARLFQGLGACATSVAAFATVRDRFGPEKSGQMISYLNGAICVIPALAPILGSVLTQWFDWRANFAFMALFSLLVGAVMFAFFKETNPQKAVGPIFKPARYWSVLKVPSFVFHASLCLLAMAVILAYVTNAPVVLMERMGLTMSEFTFWFGCNAVLNIIACLVAPKCIEKWGAHKTITVGVLSLGLAGVVMLLLSSWQTPFGFMLPIFMSSWGFAWVLGASAGKALESFGDKAGTAAALLGVFQMSGAGLLVGLIQRLDWSAETMISVHMWLIVPSLILLWSRAGRQWHWQQSH